MSLESPVSLLGDFRFTDVTIGFAYTGCIKLFYLEWPGIEFCGLLPPVIGSWFALRLRKSPVSVPAGKGMLLFYVAEYKNLEWIHSYLLKSFSRLLKTK